MRAFLVACLVAIVIATSAYVVLQSGYVRDSATSVFSTSGARVGNG